KRHRHWLAEFAHITPYRRTVSPTRKRGQPSLARRANHSPILFLQPFSSQNVMVMLCEAMRLIAHVLQKPQRRRMPAQVQRFGLAGPIDFFLLLGQRDQARRLDLQKPKRIQCCIELSLAAVDKQNVRKDLLLPCQPAKAPGYYFTDRGE